ncbi:Sodium/calcium exchanger protein-domain-containing protein [Suillus subaureus]|uniref:Sodium/calcium exchanger protein-domain-containing protein n=1 Tax=Suillus subaureus TaxID=48587 RepID=A0A9P7EHT0_9AGAM|nr:Sodium/calcium exchanger protein-domain-containing protein [Suillus subaureus]KAG1822015.1 Sodium/calcium exchanger protein-domain-containing protein [Suillus subaureus]
MSSEPSPGSTTLDILRAYSRTPSPSSPDATSINRPPDINLSLHIPDSRFSTISYNPTSILFTADKSLPNETNESPFRWNLPLPVEPEQSGPPSDGGKGQVSDSTANIWQGWRIIVFGSWFNLLLLLIPVSWTLSFVLEKHHKVIFTFSILSMIPLVKLHDLSTRELALRIGGTKAGLLNASMSNTVEMVIAITALRKCELRVVQSSLIGAILSKLLLVLGMCFFAGGLRFSEQGFDQTATQIHSSLLSISVGALLLPAAYHFAISGGKDSGSFEQKNNILNMSYGVSIILMFIYIAYLLFQFWSHKHLYQDTKLRSSKLSVKMPVNSRYLTDMLSASVTLNDKPGTTHDGQSSASSSRRSSVISSNFPPLPKFPYRNSPLSSSSETTLTGSKEHLPETTKQGLTQESTNRLAEGVSQQTAQPEHDHVDGSTVDLLNPPWSTSPMASAVDTDPIRYASPEPMTTTERANLHRSPSATDSFREPQLSWMVTLLLLTLVTITVTITAEDLVESMDGISTTISKQWVGLILLPAVSSIAECVTAVNTSVKDQLNLSVSIAVGSSIQTTLLVIPFMVTLGWIMGRPLALLFDPFESVVLYISVHTMSFVVADGKSNWLEGLILICLYFIIAVSFWFYPISSSLPIELAVCV